LNWPVKQATFPIPYISPADSDPYNHLQPVLTMEKSQMFGKVS